MSTAVKQFVHALDSLPDNPQIPEDIEQALAPALFVEKDIRQHLDSDPYIGLINVFHTPIRCRIFRPRKFDNLANLDGQYLFPLSYEHWQNAGCSSCVADIVTFKKNWAIFTHRVLDKFEDWDNVVVAGGSVLAALMQTSAQTDHELTQLYHSDAYTSSDVDMFMWGLSPAEAERKICLIFDAIKASVPWDVVAVRKAHVISIHTQFPYRHVQIILRIYRSATELLTGFDVDCSCLCFDGKHVWATPRSMASIVMRRNTIDLSRRSPSYELRLAKYARRGWEIWVPNLRRNDINPNLYKYDLRVMPVGLARLFVLEKYFADGGHYLYIRFPGKPLKSLAVGTFSFLDCDDDTEGFDSKYEYTPFQIPYALEWDAAAIKKLSKRTEDKLTTYCDVGHYLHRHVMVAHDNVQDCFSNVCATCPLPRTEEEAQQQQINDAKYIRGRLQFMVQNPSQQGISGSFNPINDNQWEVDAYRP